MSYKIWVCISIVIYIYGFFCQNIVISSDLLSGFNNDIVSEVIQNDEFASNTTFVDVDFSGENPYTDNTYNNLLSGGFGQSGLVLDKYNNATIYEEIPIGITEDEITRGQSGQEQNSSQVISENALLNNGNLVLSEVYFDGTDERIEIFNIGANSFSGTLVISGVKSSNLIINNIEILPSSYLIIGDNLSSNTSLQNSITSKGLSISDSSAIDIKILYQDVIIDSFFVGQESVSIANDKTKTSFHKLSDTREIIMTSDETTINANDGYFVNPGILYSSLDLGSEQELTGGVNTGIQILPKIMITELFPYGDDVWFELTNLSNSDFSGNLFLDGFSSGGYDFDISIPKNSSRVLSNNERYFQNLDIVKILSTSISLLSQSSIGLSLFYENELLDVFNIDQTWVEYLDGFDSSFEKIGTGESWFTTYVGLNTDRYFNTNRGYAANPGKVFESAENIVDVTIPKQQSTIPNLTGLDTICDSLDNSYLKISEYYAGDERYPMYIEVDLLNDRITDIFIGLYFSGTAIAGDNPYFDFYDYYDREEDVFFVDFDSNKKILFSNQDFWSDEMQDSLFKTGFDIQTGILEIYGFDGVDYSLLSIINISEIQNTKSVYYDGQDFQCVENFGDIDSFSPGFDKKYSKYFETIAIECPVCRCGGGGTKYISEFNSNQKIVSDIEISSIKYLDEKNQIIKIKNKSNNPINMRDYSLEILVGENKNASFQGNTSAAKTITSFLGSYGLPKNDSCINLMQNDNVVDRYCYSNLSKPSETDMNNIKNQMSFWSDLQEYLEDDELITTGSVQSGLNYGIKIEHILYDPPGLDYGNEYIQLNLINGDVFDLSSCVLQIKKDGTSTNKKIVGTLSKGKSQKIFGNYSFPNSTKDKKSVQVDLLCENVLLDTYTYNPDQEKIEDDVVLKELENLDVGIKIKSILYDPEGNDFNRENIVLSLYSGENIQITKDIYLYFDNKKRYLNTDKMLSYGEDLTITGNFQFPNTKETCVDLMYKQILLDTYCYNPDDQVVVLGSGINQYSGLEIKIISVLPNPIGSDTKGEEIVLQSNQNISLDKNFFIQIKNSKKSLENLQLLENQHTSIVKNFSLPNSSSCIYLYHGDVVMDKFCYSDPIEGQKFTQNNGVLSSIDAGDIEILQQIKFKVFGDSICSTIYDQKILCRKLSYSKLSQTKERQNGFYKSYLSSFQSYLSQNRPIVYYNTDIQKHFNLYKQIDKQIKAGETTITINGKTHSINEYEKIYQAKYPNNVLDLLSNTISPILPKQIKEIYQESYKKYIQEKA